LLQQPVRRADDILDVAGRPADRSEAERLGL
jgi:hypothetical protein